MNKFQRFLVFLKDIFRHPPPTASVPVPPVRVPVIIENSTLISNLRHNITTSIIEILDVRLPANRPMDSLSASLDALFEEYFSKYATKEMSLYLNIFLSLLFLFVIAVSLLQPLYQEMFNNERRIRAEETMNKPAPGAENNYVKVKDILITNNFEQPSQASFPPPAPLTPRKTDQRSLIKIHASTLKLHTLLGVTFKHLNACEGDPEEVKEELLMAEGCVCSAVVKVLEEIEDELGGEYRRIRSPVILPK
mmetsp:Transcript_453/g.816  ORF Transcript_453/g.816 Transcript_453/m.816 type:complete len:250 (-) Transcript_453:5-754(-)